MKTINIARSVLEIKSVSFAQLFLLLIASRWASVVVSVLHLYFYAGSKQYINKYLPSHLWYFKRLLPLVGQSQLQQLIIILCTAVKQG